MLVPPKVDYGVIDKNKRPLLYPKGTRVASLHFDRTGYSYKEDYTYIVETSIKRWKEHFGKNVDTEDLFITIAFSSYGVIIEISDRMKGL